MAIEFGSRKETFENFKVYETMLAGRPFKVEMGKMCGLSNASALIRYGETCYHIGPLLEVTNLAAPVSAPSSPAAWWTAPCARCSPRRCGTMSASP